MSETILRTLDLSKQFSHRLAVDRVNLEVKRGEIFGFLGPNGAGKSTTIRMILHLIFPTRGDVELFGLSLARYRHRALSKVGAIVEKPDFYLHLSAHRNLEIFAGLQKPVRYQNIIDHLARVGLADRALDKVKTFSHGMKQRLGLALALLTEPELVILDEPTTGLDPQGMKEVRDLIRELAQQKGITIFLSSHLLYEVEMIATQMAIIHQGKLRVQGSVKELLKQGETSVLIKTDRLTETLHFIRSIPEYVSAEIHADGISVKIEHQNIPDFNKRLVLAGLPVSALIPQRSLETYFLNLIENNGDEAPDPVRRQE